LFRACASLIYSLRVSARMTPEEIARRARKSIGQFCMEECKAYCCRKGFLVMTVRQAELLSSGDIDSYVRKSVLHLMENGSYSMDLNVMSCPRLADGVCTIHRHRNRPDACKQFPLFIDGNLIKLSPRCLAVKQGKLYPFIVQLLKMGYRLAEPDAYSDTELYRFEPGKTVA
jgi:Fe-S-cluster containining protein